MYINSHWEKGKSICSIWWIYMHDDNLEAPSTDLEALRNLRLQSSINQVRKIVANSNICGRQSYFKAVCDIDRYRRLCSHRKQERYMGMRSSGRPLTKAAVLATANLRALCPSNKRLGASSFCSTAWQSSIGKLSWICRSNIPSGVPAPGAVCLATTVASWARCNLWRPEISDSDRSSQHSV
jgi:hypothetical protein